MRLYHAYVCTKFEANRSKNTATVAQNVAKWTFLRHNIATSLCHDVFFHMLRCAYTMSMFPPNMKQISRKTRPQWPKNHQNGRFYVITSRRRYVMTFFFTCCNAPIPCPCFHQVWSKSVEKHGHSGPKTPKWTFLRHNVATFLRHNVAMLLRHDVFSHMLQCAYTMSMFPPIMKQIGRKTWRQSLIVRRPVSSVTVLAFMVTVLALVTVLIT